MSDSLGLRLCSGRPAEGLGSEAPFSSQNGSAQHAVGVSLRRGGDPAGKSPPRRISSVTSLQILKHPGLGLQGERWVSVGFAAAWCATWTVGGGRRELLAMKFPPFSGVL